MSWLKKGLKGVGKLAVKAAPYVGMLPGVGTVGAAALGGLGGLMSGTSIGRGAAGGALGGLAGGALGKFGGLIGAGAGALGLGGGGEAGGGGLDLSKFLKGAGGLIGQGYQALGGTPQDLLQAALTGYSGYQGVKASGEAEKGMAGALASQQEIAQRMQQLAEERHGQSSPARLAALEKLQSRISAGPRATPSTSRFADVLNPFRARFGGMPGAEPTGPSPLIAAAALPAMPAPPGGGGGAAPPPPAPAPPKKKKAFRDQFNRADIGPAWSGGLVRTARGSLM